MNIEELTKQAEEGDAEAQYKLSVMYRFGEGVEKDRQHALILTFKAAKQGHAKAQCTLGHLYSSNLGRDVEQNLVVAVDFYKSASDLGCYQASNELGSMYRTGWGVREDSKQSKRYFALANQQYMLLTDEEKKENIHI